jgi:hypothetical protein
MSEPVNEVAAKLPPWQARQREEAVLFNPAFLATLLAAAAADHERVGGDGLRWPLAFLVPTLALYADTRSDLPANTNARLLNWISAHAGVRAQLATRAPKLAPFIREATRFGMRQGTLTFAGDRLHSSRDAASLRSGASGEAADCVAGAAFLGRWFQGVVDVASIYALFGVRP